jgi:O-antigen ligase
LIFWLSSTILAVSLILGGSRAGALLPQLLAFLLIVLAAPTAWARRSELDRLSRTLLASILLLPPLQIIPVPSFVWTSLPGRSAVAGLLSQTGTELPYLGVSLQPQETLAAYIALFPGISLFAASFSLSARQRSWLIGVALAVGFLSLPISMLQVIGGAASAFDFYGGTGRGVGFFVNANHLATYLAVLIPLTAGLFAERGSWFTMPPWILGLGLTVSYLLALSLTGSRSALVLAAIGLAGSTTWIVRPEFGRYLSRRVSLLVGLVVLLVVAPIALGMGLLATFGRFGGNDVAEDARWKIYRVTLDAAGSYFPFGSGLGTFDRVYQWHEPVSAIGKELINNAHSDWLELLLEAGGPGVVLMAVWTSWLMLRSRETGPSKTGRLSKAAALGLCIISVHSLWDYPARATGISALVGLLCGMLAVLPRGRGSAASREQPRPSEFQADWR